MIPIPPSQWVKERQNSKLWGSASISVRIVEPVVVKPLIVSKMALSGEAIAPEIRYGNAPKTANTAQPKVTTANPSRTVNSLGLLQKENRRPPTTKQMTAERI